MDINTGEEHATAESQKKQRILAEGIHEVKLLASGLATAEFVTCLTRRLRLRKDTAVIKQDLIFHIRRLVEALHLHPSNWSARRRNALETFTKVWVPRLQTSTDVARDFPVSDILQMIKTLDLLLFNGSIADKVSFEWQGVSPDGLLGECYDGDGFQRAKIVIYAGGRTSGALMVGTLVHEMIHAFIALSDAVARHGPTKGNVYEPWLTAIGEKHHGYCFQILAVAMEDCSEDFGYKFDIGGYDPYDDQAGDFAGIFANRLSGLSNFVRPGPEHKEPRADWKWRNLHARYKDRAETCLERYKGMLWSTTNLNNH